MVEAEVRCDRDHEDPGPTGSELSRSGQKNLLGQSAFNTLCRFLCGGKEGGDEEEEGEDSGEGTKGRASANGSCRRGIEKP